MLLGLVGVVIFGGTLPATRVALGVFSPGFVTYGRAALATRGRGSCCLPTCVAVFRARMSARSC